MQGLTDEPFRRLHAKYFGGVDFYYTPFIRIERGLFRKRDLRDLTAEQMSNVIPQILPSSAEELKHLCEPILEKGCKQIDVNVGCPFPPVMAHGRGAALLNNPDSFADVLKGIRELSNDISFSLKMRLGYSDSNQWQASIDAINDTPLAYVTMHARIAKQQYRGTCDMGAFGQFAAQCKHPLVYNGDILITEGAENVLRQWPNLQGLMIGRGLLGNLDLGRKLRGDVVDGQDFIARFKAFHEELFLAAKSRMTEDRQVAEHLKPYWDYFFQYADRKDLKAIRKSHKSDDYMAAVCALLSHLGQ